MGSEDTDLIEEEIYIQTELINLWVDENCSEEMDYPEADVYVLYEMQRG